MLLVTCYWLIGVNNQKQATRNNKNIDAKLIRNFNQERHLILNPQHIAAPVNIDNFNTLILT